MKDCSGSRSAGRYVAMIHRFARRYFVARLDEMGLPRATFPFLLPLLRHDDVSQDALAQKSLIDKATVARKIAQLEEAGLVKRTVDEDDRRIKRVRVTEKARDLEPQLHSLLRGWGEKLMDGFTVEERESALSYLERMAANAHRHWEEAAKASVADVAADRGD